MAKSAKRPTAVFSLKKLGRIGDFILAVRTIALNILNNAGIFVGPVPTPATLKTSADVLETATGFVFVRLKLLCTSFPYTNTPHEEKMQAAKRNAKAKNPALTSTLTGRKIKFVFFIKLKIKRF